MDLENVRKIIAKSFQLTELAADLTTQRPHDAQALLDITKRLLNDAFVFLTPVASSVPVVEVKNEEAAS